MTSNEEKPRKVEEVATDNQDDEMCKTFIIHNEDHTLGNSLRYIVMKNSDVQFCGYSIPHPSEDKINFRIQTYGKPAKDVLKKGLKDLTGLCEHVLVTFEKSVVDYNRRNKGTDSAMDVSNG